MEKFFFITNWYQQKKEYVNKIRSKIQRHTNKKDRQQHF